MIHFYFETPNIADWISVILTIIGLAIGVGALFSWKSQKQWELLVESIAYAPKAWEYVDFRFNVQSDASLFNEKSLDEIEDLSAKLLIVSILRKQKALENAEDSIRLLNGRLKFVFKEKENIVCEYYSEVVKKLDEINALEQEIILYTSFNELHEKNPAGSTKETVHAVNKKLSDAHQKSWDIPKAEIKRFADMLDQIEKYRIR